MDKMKNKGGGYGLRTTGGRSNWIPAYAGMTPSHVRFFAMLRMTEGGNPPLSINGGGYGRGATLFLYTKDTNLPLAGNR